MQKSKKIVVAPLDWGLGHASRCIPIIRYLLKKKYEVIIGADKRPLALLRSEFPTLEFVVMPGYNITYPANGSMALKMASSIPKIVSGIKKEHIQLEKLIESKKIDLVISDNRFGLWTKKIPCVFITHQVMIKAPIGENILHRLNKNYINKFTECWVPDLPGEENLSGDLSHKFPLPGNARYIGPLSRFSKNSSEEEDQLLVVLSGPEPQRSIFEKKIIAQIKKYKIEALIVQGITESNKTRTEGSHCKVVSHLSSNDLQKEIVSSKYVLCRSGYSTIMDLAILGKKNIIFVPTPGQTEQEYLAKLFSKKKVAYSDSQKKIDLKKAMEECGKYTGFPSNFRNDEFESAVDSLLG